MLDASGALDRKALARIVFEDAEARAALEAIVHPIVQAATTDWFAHLDPTTPFAVSDIPLLYEIGREADFDVVVVAACSPQTQLVRLVERDGVSEVEAQRRIAAQWPIDEKRRRADYVISTEGTIEDSARATEAVYASLRRRTWG